MARSAADPDDPVSHWGSTTQTFYLDISQIDAWKSGNPASDLKVETSYGGGASQTVEVLAKRSAGAVALQYRIDGGAAQTATTPSRRTANASAATTPTTSTTTTSGARSRA